MIRKKTCWSKSTNFLNKKRARTRNLELVRQITCHNTYFYLQFFTVYIGYHTCADQKRLFGRNIKGVSIYLKNTANEIKTTEIINEKGNLLILKLSCKNWKNFKDLHLIICYKEDRESKFKTKNYFEILKQHIINFKIRNMIIVGDLNGRIGWLNDNEEMKLKPRLSDDLVVNPQGREIIDFCNETKLIIMNGRFEDGRCTYYAMQNNIEKNQ